MMSVCVCLCVYCFSTVFKHESDILICYQNPKLTRLLASVCLQMTEGFLLVLLKVI